MAAAVLLATVSVLFWAGLAAVSGQPAFLLVAAATGAIYGAPFLAWVRRKH
jgi:hypothetical protein